MALSYRNTDIETIAEDILVAALGLHRTVYLTCEVSELVSLPMEGLLDAGVGFSILDTISGEPNLLVIERPELDESSDASTIDAYFTTSGDDPVVVPEATQADLVRSAGGWSDAQPEPVDETVGDTRDAKTWAEFRLYLARKAAERLECFVAMFDWIRSQTSAVRLKTGFAKFRRLNAENFAAAKKASDWSQLKLTKSQANTLTKYYHIKLRMLP